MLQKTQELRLQAALLILFSCSVFSVLGMALLNGFPFVGFSKDFIKGPFWAILTALVGLSSLTLLSSRLRARISMTRTTIFCGILSVSGSFLMFSMATWAIHAERVQGAVLVLERNASILESGMATHTGVINRIASSWDAFGNELRPERKRSDIERYFSYFPALDSLMVLGDGNKPFWRTARSGEELFWLTDQMSKQHVVDWLSNIEERRDSQGWLLPDSANPFKALAVLKSPQANGPKFLAVFDLHKFLILENSQGGQEFDVGVFIPEENAVGSELSSQANTTDVEKSIIFHTNQGLEIGLRAQAGPPPPLSFRTLFPVCLLIFGLIMSYLLMVGRGFLRAYKQQTSELRLAEQEFRSLFSQSPDAVFAVDERGRFRKLNDVARQIIDLGSDDVGVTHFREVLSAGMMSLSDQAAFQIAFVNALQGLNESCKLRFTSPSTCEARDYDCDFLPTVVDGDVSGVYIIAKDTTEANSIQERQRILERSLESSDNGVVVVDIRSDNLPVVFLNSAFSQLTGYVETEVLGEPVSFLAGPETAKSDIKRIKQAVSRGESLSLTMKSYSRNGRPFWNQVSLAPVRDDNGKLTHYAAIMRDISEKREQERQLAYQATHDALTGLGNRSLFEDHLRHDLLLARRHGTALAVLFIDLDEFKPINDTLGHKIGDELLTNVARRLETVSRKTDTLVRFGGDEFVLLMPNLCSDAKAGEVAERILAELAKPHLIGTHELYISASIGISMLSPDVESPEKLLQQADMAMYKAKQQGRDTYEVFSPDLDSVLSRRVVLRNELQEAIKAGQLFLHYQPQVDHKGELCGLEALIRWKHPEKGFISPADFIPIAEETGQIVQLGKWVTSQACRDAQILVEKKLLKGRMAVNLSPLQFHRQGFLDSVSEILDETGLLPDRLELELTEGVLMKDKESAVEILDSLAALGISTAIDDFGTGFSSFGYLRDLPVKKIKIDQSFVGRIQCNEKDAAVCKGMITMAREMDLRIVAEGVETREQYSILRNSGCEAFQGYYFARPMAFEQLLQWLETDKKGFSFAEDQSSNNPDLVF